MKFAILDDYAPEAEALETLIGGYCARRFIDCDICVFHTVEDFTAMFAPGRFDVLFLDIYLEPERASGVELGRVLEERLFEMDKVYTRSLFCGD